MSNYKSLTTEEREIKKIKELLTIIPKEQKESVFGQELCEIDGNFVGFIKIYENLSKIIPLNYTVIDLGCAYNPQCFYFIQHEKYIAVDINDCKKFEGPNCIIYNKSIRKFIEEDLNDINLNSVFAICSYVPPWGEDNIKLVRETFPNVFTFYPFEPSIFNKNKCKPKNFKGKTK